MKQKHRAWALPLMATIVGLSGCGIVHKGDPQWASPVLSKEGCPNIDGTYFYDDSLAGLFSAYRPAEGETIPMTVEIYRNLPRDVFSRRQLHTSIQRKERAIEVIDMDKTGKPYAKVLLNLDHPWVGCYNDALVVRRWTIINSAEAACGSAFTGEFEFRKLPDKSLEARVLWKQWDCSMNKEPKREIKTMIFEPVQ